MDPDQFAQALRDERSLRLAAERRVADLTAKVATWRGRAEDRAHRIVALEDERDAWWVRRAARAVRRGWGAGSSPDAAAGEVSGRGAPDGAIGRGDAAAGPDGDCSRATPWRAFPSTRVVAVVASGDATIVSDQFLRLDPADARAWEEADLVVLEDLAWAGADVAVRELAEHWAAQEGGAPGVHVVSGTGEGRGSGEVLPGDPARVTRVAFGARARPDATRLSHVVDLGGAGPWTHEDAVVAGPVDWDDPDPDQLAAAAAGRLERSDADPERSRAVALRLALRLHAPWVRAAQLVGLVGLDPAPAPCGVGVALVSRRPQEVAHALRNILRSDHVELEVVVGLHGHGVTDELRALAAEASVPVTLLELPQELTLGGCLNAAFSHCSTPFVAKVDDDDHYGPGHLEDAVQMLRWTGADLVGKAEQFTWVEAADRTVRRRVGTNHAFVDGTPSGATWVLRRSIWERAPFPHRVRRVDDLALGGMRAAGARVYVNGPWEFCVTRLAEGHTWVAADETFLDGAAEAWPGRDDHAIELDESIVT